MHKWIPLYFIGVAIPAYKMPKQTCHAYEATIYTFLEISLSIVIWRIWYIQYIQMTNNAPR